MDPSILELTIISAEDLKDVRHVGKMQTYATIQLHTSERKSTQVDKRGGVNPVWNKMAWFALPNDMNATHTQHKEVIIEVVSLGLMGHKVVVGEVHIPLIDILKRASFSNKMHYGSYPIRFPSSTSSHGQLHVSFRLNSAK